MSETAQKTKLRGFTRRSHVRVQKVASQAESRQAAAVAAALEAENQAAAAARRAQNLRLAAEQHSTVAADARTRAEQIRQAEADHQADVARLQREAQEAETQARTEAAAQRTAATEQVDAAWKLYQEALNAADTVDEQTGEKIRTTVQRGQQSVQDRHASHRKTVDALAKGKVAAPAAPEQAL